MASRNPKADRPLTSAKERHAFRLASPTKHIDRMRVARKEKGEAGIALSELWVGIAAEKKDDGSVDIGFACHDGTYNIDFAIHTLRDDSEEEVDGVMDGEMDGVEEDSSSTELPTDTDGQEMAIADYVVCSIRNYAQKNHYKLLGAGLSQELVKLSPRVPARLWTELDIVPVVIPESEGGSLQSAKKVDGVQGVDELADALTRKCLTYVDILLSNYCFRGGANEITVTSDPILSRVCRWLSATTWKST